ncbi:MPI isoform 9 [Pongo abelii]|uniref:MPI isoform 9 n=1 Tax=Pongo abelii TaxID=9601 RepID=A0A2J8UDI4_PONAB|nr:MPI isoform 9 [Pongo abelii]
MAAPRGEPLAGVSASVLVGRVLGTTPGMIGQVESAPGAPRKDGIPTFLCGAAVCLGEDWFQQRSGAAVGQQ